MLLSDHHQLVTNTYGSTLGLNPPPAPPGPAGPPPDGASIDIAAPLFGHLPALTFALHLVYEVGFATFKKNMTYLHDFLPKVKCHSVNYWPVLLVLVSKGPYLLANLGTDRHYNRP